MSCLHKQPKRTKSQELVLQEKAKKVAQENGKRLGKTPYAWNTRTRHILTHTPQCLHNCGRILTVATGISANVYSCRTKLLVCSCWELRM